MREIQRVQGARQILQTNVKTTYKVNQSSVSFCKIVGLCTNLRKLQFSETENINHISDIQRQIILYLFLTEIMAAYQNKNAKLKVNYQGEGHRGHLCHNSTAKYKFWIK